MPSNSVLNHDIYDGWYNTFQLCFVLYCYIPDLRLSYAIVKAEGFYKEKDLTLCFDICWMVQCLVAAFYALALICQFSFPLTRSSKWHRQRWQAGKQWTPCRLLWPHFFSSLPQPAEVPTTQGHWTDSAPQCSQLRNCKRFNIGTVFSEIYSVVSWAGIILKR